MEQIPSCVQDIVRRRLYDTFYAENGNRELFRRDIQLYWQEFNQYMERNYREALETEALKLGYLRPSQKKAPKKKHWWRRS